MVVCLAFFCVCVIHGVLLIACKIQILELILNGNSTESLIRRAGRRRKIKAELLVNSVLEESILDICSNGLRKAMKNLRQDSRSLG
jgi:hypothetical protein